ncbi:MAG TPA: alpha/beta hydrolase [Woeseiaceae bacterium]|nr:alpha/beta hydrolase [Woeseiaceae bacterium]
MISVRARLIRFLAKQYFRQVTPATDVRELRASFENLTRHLRPPRHVDERRASFAGVDCDWLVPRGSEQAPVLLYLHGGAYVMGSSRTHRRLAGFIARAAGVRALLPNYRLAPEYPYPAGLDDAVAVYRALRAQGLPAARIVVAGDSAGGGLAAATVLALRDAGDALPAALVLLSPWLDLAGRGDSMQTRAGVDPLFRPADMPAAAAHYCNSERWRDPLVSPVYADLHGLPPVFIQVGDHEILLSDATRFSDAVSNAGGAVTLQIWPGMWHVFQFFVGRMPESARAIADIAGFIGRHRPAANA